MSESAHTSASVLFYIPPVPFYYEIFETLNIFYGAHLQKLNSPEDFPVEEFGNWHNKIIIYAGNTQYGGSDHTNRTDQSGHLEHTYHLDFLIIPLENILPEVSMLTENDDSPLVSFTERHAEMPSGAIEGYQIKVNNFAASLSEKHITTGNEVADFPVIIRKLRQTEKKELKRRLFKILEAHTGRIMPWGSLTGIKPVKIVNSLHVKGMSDDEILSYLKEFHFVSEEKSSLLLEVAQNSRQIIENFLKDRETHRSGIPTYSFYAGIPFCPTKCHYCSFGSFVSSSNSKNPLHASLPVTYMTALLRELSLVALVLSENKNNIGGEKRSGNLRLRSKPSLQTIYIGGGTPAIIEPTIMKHFLDSIENYYDLESLQEFTFEAGRPDVITSELLKAIKTSAPALHVLQAQGKKGLRICINPQSMNQATLDRIGRKHTPEDVITAFHMARDEGYENINMDIIAGLSGEDIRMFENTLSQIKMLNPESLTVHALSIKRASRLHEEAVINRTLKKNIKKNFHTNPKANFKSDPDNSTMATEMTVMAHKTASAMGMVPYYLYRQKNTVDTLENTGYCKPGFECIYNVQMMEERQPIIALGADAVSRNVSLDGTHIERCFNIKDVHGYISRLEELCDRKKALFQNS